ncbi:MAG: hypothetical protein AB7K09_16250 [Planctomycetota bacterium]
MDATHDPRSRVVRRRAIALGALVALAVGAALVIAQLAHPGAQGPAAVNNDTGEPGIHRVLSGVSADGAVHLQLRTYYLSPVRDEVFQSSMASRLGYAEGAWSVFVLNITRRASASNPPGNATSNEGGSAGSDNRPDNRRDNRPGNAASTAVPPLEIHTVALKLQLSNGDEPGSAPTGSPIEGGPLSTLPLGDVGPQGRLLIDTFSPPVSVEAGWTAALRVAFPGHVDFTHAVRATVTIDGIGAVTLTASDEPYVVPPGLRNIGANRR